MTDSVVTVRRALLSVFKKDGIVDFARFLAQQNVEILSTGGTAKLLRESGLSVVDVADVTEWPEMLDGRVKTLHPRIHGGLLYRRDLADHCATAAQHGIPSIDLLVIDLYPFAETVLRPGASTEDIIEMIDIGGPAMIRAAAKNHAHVTVITDPADMERVRAHLLEWGGGTTFELRRGLAAKAYRRTAAYDAEVAGFMSTEKFPERLTVTMELESVARYGENPHQEGAVYRTRALASEPTVAHAKKLSGKELSYNNYLDASAAFDCVKFLGGHAAVVVKHRNPCGAAIAGDLIAAFDGAYAGDPLSAFGGIVAINGALEKDLAERIADPQKFFEVIIAPSFSAEAVEILTTRTKWGKNVRLLETGPLSGRPEEGVIEYRSISGGMLVQDRDVSHEAEFRCATRSAPTEQETSDLRLAWEVCRHAVSNAIIFVRGGRVVGMGSGHPSRVDAVEQAAKKAGPLAQGAVMASEAFFPFPDAVEAGAKVGIRAVIQPGGSIRDDQIVEAADTLGIAMVMTGRRHFRH